MKINRDKINEQKRELGQPTELTEDDKMVERVALRVTQELKKHICRRCTAILTSEEEKRGFCPNCWSTEKDRRDFERLERTKRLNSMMEGTKREIEFKTNQIEKGEIVETKVITIKSNGERNVLEGYKDSLKPKYLLQNEVGTLNANLELYKRQLELIKKAEEEDAASNKGD